MLTDNIKFEDEWWRIAFDEDWAMIFAYKDKYARKEAQAIHKILKLPLPARVLDLCCGNGRISLQLARLGYDVTGLDLSTTLLQSARYKAQQSNLNIKWIQRDMRDIKLSNAFDAIINISTSFGYFAKEEDDIRTLYSAAKALQTKGKLILDLENIHFLSNMARRYGTAPTYQPVKRFKGWIEETTIFDPISHVIQMNLRFWYKEKLNKEIRGRYRVYSLPEIRSLLELSGFHIQSIYGDFNLRAYNVDSPRMILLCEKSN